MFAATSAIVELLEEIYKIYKTDENPLSDPAFAMSPMCVASQGNICQMCSTQGTHCLLNSFPGK